MTAAHEIESVDLHLRDALDALDLAMRNAVHVGFGGQFRASIEEAIKAVEASREMLK